MLRTLTDQLVQHERIETTCARARELRRWAEHAVTLGKRGSSSARERASALTRTRPALDKLFGALAERYAARPGGYTRVLHSRFRLKDSARMALIEYVDRPVRLFLSPRRGARLWRSARSARVSVPSE